MTLMQAAVKWDLSLNWVRELVRSGRIPGAKLVNAPVPYYEIPDSTPKPTSMARLPHRKMTERPVKEASLRRREYRRKQRERLEAELKDKK